MKILALDELDATSARRFERECAAMGRISAHPNVVTVFESGFTPNGQPFIVSELCQGSYADRVKAYGPLPSDEVAAVGAKISAALTAAHAQGMVHRDVKPANILLTSYGEPVLADFGLSLRPDIDATRGVDAYTPSHASPETLARGASTPGSDAYSLASTLYTLLCGTPPFPVTPGENLGGHAVRVMRDAPPPLTGSAPGALADLIMHGLSKDPSQRPPLPWPVPTEPDEATLLRTTAVVTQRASVPPSGSPAAVTAAPGATSGSGRGPRLLIVLAGVLVVVLLAGAGVYARAGSGYYVGASQGKVALFKGNPAGFLGYHRSEVVERSILAFDLLGEVDAQRVRNHIAVNGPDEGRLIITRLVVGVANPEADPTATPTPTPKAPATSKPSATRAPVAGGASCTYGPASASAKPVSGKPPTSNVAMTTQKVTLSTNQGTIALSLNGAMAPCTVNSFTFLTGQKYFDGTSCHRLTTSGIYVLQCGDPNGTGSGGPGYQFADENLTGATYPRGTVAMANAGPGTNGSQFFLVYQDTQLPPSYTPFGQITGGLAILERVARAGPDPEGDGRPKLGVTIRKATVS